MTTAVVMGIFLVRKPKCKPPSNRSSVLLLYLCIFCKNWFGTIELILDSIIDTTTDDNMFAVSAIMIVPRYVDCWSRHH